MNYLIDRMISRNGVRLLESTVMCPKHADQMPQDLIINRLNAVEPCEICAREAWEAWQDYHAKQSNLLREVVESECKLLYLAGPMTGLIDYNRPAFHRMKRLLAMIGKAALSPADHPEDQPYEWYMTADLKMLLEAEGAIFLQGWRQSRGAVLEHEVAEITGKKAFYET